MERAVECLGVLVLVLVLVLGACFSLFGRKVVSLAIRGVQKLQRDTLATMVLLVLQSGDL